MKIVLALSETDTHREVVEHLRSWSENQLIGELVLCWTGESQRYERVAGGACTATKLAEELEVGDQMLLVAVAAWSEKEQAQVADQVAATVRARQEVLNILPAAQVYVREEILVLVPPGVEAVVPPGCLRQGRRTFIVSPEEREAPGGTNHLVENKEILHAHAAAALVSLTGLWAGTEGLAVPLVTEPDPQVANANLARSVAAYTRIVDVGYVVDHVAKHALGSSSSWPNPDPSQFEDVRRDDALLTRLTGFYLKTYPEVFGPTVIEQRVEEEEPKLGLIEAWLRFLRELWETIKLKPLRMAEDFLRKAYDRASQLTEKITGYKVDRWDEPEEPIETMRMKAEERYRSADGPVVDAWTDLKRLCVGMTDGSDIPECLPESLVVQTGGRRLLVLNAHGYVPDPQVRPPLLGVSACDPRAIAAAIAEAGDDALGGPDPKLVAFAEQRRSTVVWQVGSRISANIDEAARELAEAERKIEELREQIVEEQERIAARSLQLGKGVTRLLLIASALGLTGIGASIGLALTQKFLVTVFSAIGLFGIWAGVVAFLGLRLVRLRRRYNVDTTARIVELSDQAVKAGIRQADVDRLLRRYDEYLDWAEIMGWLLHEPWTAPDAEAGDAGVDRNLPLPPSVQRAVGHIAPDTVMELEASGASAVFAPKWLDQVERAQRESAMRTYLAIRERVPDHEAVGRALPDPYGDTRVGEGTPRDYFKSAVMDVDRRRRLGDEALAQIEKDLKAHWPVGRIVDGIVPGQSDNDLTAPRPGWVSEPPQLRQLSQRLRPAVVQIRRDGVGGSGVLIGRGTVLTNAHVVSHQLGEVQLYLAGDWKPVTGRVEKVSQTTDLAVVSFETDAPSAEAVDLADERPAQGATVLTLGFPLLLEGDPTLSWGYVSAPHRTITLDRDDGGSWRLDVLQCSYASAGGASGSGVFDGRGALVGLHCAGQVRDERADDFMSFAVPVDVIREFLSEAQVTTDAGNRMIPPGDDADPGEPLQAFLSELATATGDVVFGHEGPWKPGSAPVTADLITGVENLDASNAAVDARHGAFTVFVRSVTVMSEPADGDRLR